MAASASLLHGCANDQPPDSIFSIQGWEGGGGVELEWGGVGWGNWMGGWILAMKMSLVHPNVHPFYTQIWWLNTRGVEPNTKF